MTDEQSPLRAIDRRRFLLGAMGAAVAVGLAACGSDDDADRAATTTSATPAATTAPAESSAPAATSAPATSEAAPATSEPPVSTEAPAFPVTVTHVHGETTIKSEPQRVISYGYTDQDPILALGVVPVGILQWIPEWKRGVGPWSEAALGDAKPAIFKSQEVDFEGIAAANPDLIMIVNYDLKKEDYEKLSKLAPTVPTVSGYPAYGTPWDVASKQIGAALGRPTEMQALIDAAQAGFETAKADHPGWAGKKVVMATPDAGGKLYIFADTDTRGRFVSSLGFEQPDEFKELVGDEFYASISPERFDLLDGDALIMLADATATQAALEDMPTYQKLDVVQDGRVVMVKDLDLSMALSASSVTSIPFALERLVPELEGALGA